MHFYQRIGRHIFIQLLLWLKSSLSKRIAILHTAICPQICRPEKCASKHHRVRQRSLRAWFSIITPPPRIKLRFIKCWYSVRCLESDRINFKTILGCLLIHLNIIIQDTSHHSSKQLCFKSSLHIVKQRF